MRRPPLDLRRLEPRRVCIIKPSSLGDVVHALPTLAALRSRWPVAHFAWVINSGLRGLVDDHPMIDEVIPFDRARLRPTPGGLWASGRLLGRIAAGRFDLAIDLQGLLRSAWMAAAARAPVRLGLAEAREGAGHCYTHAIEAPPGRPHAIDRMLALAEACGAEIDEPRYVIAMQPADRTYADAELAAVPRPRLVLNVGARWPTKRWPPESFAEVAWRAAERLGAGLVAVGAPEDAPLVARLRDRLGPYPLLDLCGRTTLPQLAAVAAGSDLFLSNDTGPLHLAAAAGARVVGLYTCTRPETTGPPPGPNARVIRSHLWCAGSRLKACARLECFAELSPDRVWSELAPLLAGPGRSAA